MPAAGGSGPDALVGRVLGWEAGSFTASFLGKGLTNRNFLVSRGGERYVVRLGGPASRELGIDRRAEHAAMAAVGRVGIGPDPVWFDIRTGDMITRYIRGSTWSAGEFARPRISGAVARTLRRVHGLTAIPYRFSPYDDIRDRLAIVKAAGISVPREAHYVSRVSDIRAERNERPREQTGLCHNDLFLGNFLYDGSVRIIDWEFAGMGDVMFDLACVACYQSGWQQREFLKAYFGHCDDGLVRSLGKMKLVANFWNALWALVRMTKSDGSYDYARQARTIFTVMEGL